MMWTKQKLQNIFSQLLVKLFKTPRLRANSEELYLTYMVSRYHIHQGKWNLFVGCPYFQYIVAATKAPRRPI